MEETYIVVRTKGHQEFRGEPERVREWVEERFVEKTGLFVYLQEDFEDGEFELYLHSSFYDDADEETIEKLENMGISDDPETTKAIEKILGVKFFVEEIIFV